MYYLDGLKLQRGTHTGVNCMWPVYITTTICIPKTTRMWTKGQIIDPIFNTLATTGPVQQNAKLAPIQVLVHSGLSCVTCQWVTWNSFSQETWTTNPDKPATTQSGTWSHCHLAPTPLSVPTYVVQVASLTLVRFVHSAVTFSSRAQGAAIAADDAACGTYPWCCSYRQCERSWLWLALLNEIQIFS